jgi:hypothetical protein
MPSKPGKEFRIDDFDSHKDSYSLLLLKVYSLINLLSSGLKLKL